MPTPVFQAVGAQANGTATVNVSWPTHLANDIGIMVIETDGAGATLTPPSGWVAVTGTPVVDVATAGSGSKLHIWWKRAASSAEPAVATGFGAGSDHVLSRIYTFRGCAVGGNPWEVSTTSTKTTASTSVTIPSLTTTGVEGALVTWIVSRPNDNLGTAEFPVATFAGLTGVAEAGEAGTNNGNGGGFTLQYGTDAAPGATGTGTISPITVSVTNAIVAFALRPPRTLISSVGTFTRTGINANLVRTRIFPADSGSFAVTGKDATLKQYRLTADTGRVGIPVKNLYKYSEELNVASYWLPTGVTVTANAAIAPNGLQVADFVADDTSTFVHAIAPGDVSVLAGRTYTQSIYVKSTSTPRRDLVLTLFGDFVQFNTSTNSATSTGGTLVTWGTVSIGNGWWRYYITKLAATTGSGTSSFQLYDPVADNGVYNGNGSSGLYLWGAQVEESSLDAYEYTRLTGAAGPTSLKYARAIAANAGAITTSGNAGLRKTWRVTADLYKVFAPTNNLVPYSEEQNNWINNITTQSGILAPDGTYTATRLIETTTNTIQDIYRNVLNVPAIANVYASAYVKAFSGRRIRLYLGGQWSSTDATTPEIIFDFTSGTIVSSSSTVAGSGVTAVGNGWFRIWLQVNKNYSSAGTHAFRIRLDNGTASGYLGDGASGEYVWGAQFETDALTDYKGTHANVGVLAKLVRTIISPSTTGGYSVASVNTTFKRGLVLTAQNGSISYNGNAATLKKGFYVLSNAGAYFVNGGNATLVVIRNPPSDPGAYTVTGKAATFRLGYVVTCNKGTYTVSGQSAGFQGQRYLRLDAGLISATGIPAALKKQFVVPAETYKTFIAERNTVTYSEDFAQSAWTKSRTSVSSNTAVAPDGTLTADTLIDDTTAANTHILNRNKTDFIEGNYYTASLYIKQYLNRNIALMLGTVSIFGGTQNTLVLFNFSNNLIGATQNSPDDFGSQSVGNGWYRIWVTKRCVATGTGAIQIQLRSASANVYDGDGVSGAYIWGAQWEEGFISTYDGTGANIAGNPSLKKGYYLSAAVGSTTVTGVNNQFRRYYVVTSNAGSIAVSGQAAVTKKGFTLISSTGSFSQTGVAATLKRGYYINSQPGSATVNGNTAVTKKGFSVLAGAGIFSVVGVNIQLRNARRLSCATGSATVTGQSAGFQGQRYLRLNTGNYSVNGVASTLTKGFYLIQEAGGTFGHNISVVGNNSSLKKGFYIGAIKGTFTVTTFNANLLHARRLVSNAGAISVTGNTAVLKKGFYIAANVTTFNLTGNAATLGRGYYIALVKGTYTLTGNNATLKKGFYIASSVGGFTWSGNSATLLNARRISGQVGSIVFTGQSAGFQGQRYLRLDPGNFVFTGKNAITLKQFKVIADQYKVCIPERNLVVFSEQLNASGWQNTNTTIVNNVATAPDGTLTADKIVVNSGTGLQVRRRTSNITYKISQNYVASVYLKAAEMTTAALFFDTTCVNGDYYGSGWTVNLSTGAVTGSLQAISVGNGWYRVWLTTVGDACGAVSINLGASIVPGSTGNVNSITGNGVDGIYAWGAQVEEGTTPSTYDPTALTAAAITVTKKGFYLAANTGSSLITGKNAVLAKGYYIYGQNGQYSVTGIDIDIDHDHKLYADAATYDLLGQSAGTNHDKTFSGDHTDFHFTGNDIQFYYDYVVTCNTGNATIVGKTASTNKGFKVLTSAGNYQVTGTTAGSYRKYVVTTATGQIQFTGNSAGFQGQRYLPVQSGSFVVSGNNITLKKGFRLFADTGARTVTGNNVILAKGLRVITSAGSITLTGRAAGLYYGRVVTAVTGSYQITGKNAITKKGFYIQLTKGQISVTGNQSILAIGYRVLTSTGSYSVSGNAIVLTKGFRIITEHRDYAVVFPEVWLIHDWIVKSDTGGYSWSGNATRLIRDARIYLNTGNYVFTGKSIGFQGQRYLPVTKGSYLVSGNNISLNVGYHIFANTGSIQETGNDASLNQGYRIFLETGQYSINGQASRLAHDWRIFANASEYTVTGTDITLAAGYHVSANTGEFAATGNDSDLLHGYQVNTETGSTSIAGAEGDFIYDYYLTTTGSTFLISTNSAGLGNARYIQQGVGAFTVQGVAAKTLKGYTVIAASGSINTAGSPAGVVKDIPLYVTTGQVNVTTIPALTLRGKAVITTAGQYQSTGNAAKLLYGRTVIALHADYEVFSYQTNGFKGYTVTGNKTNYNISVNIAALLTEERRRVIIF